VLTHRHFKFLQRNGRWCSPPTSVIRRENTERNASRFVFANTWAASILHERQIVRDPAVVYSSPAIVSVVEISRRYAYSIPPCHYLTVRFGNEMNEIANGNNSIRNCDSLPSSFRNNPEKQYLRARISEKNPVHSTLPPHDWIL